MDGEDGNLVKEFFPFLALHLSSPVVSIIIAIFTVAVKGLSSRVFKYTLQMSSPDFITCTGIP